MAKGAAAKELVIKKLQQAFGSDYIGELDKKIYVWSEENGERLQIAISLTCPKKQVESINNTQKNDFSGHDYQYFGKY